MGELSSARQAFEGAEIAPGSHATLQALTTEDKTTSQRAPSSVCDRFRARFSVQPRRGAASGPSGMTYEHLRPLLNCQSDLVVLHKLGERFARAQVQPIVDAIRMGRVTALRKRDGGVRGIFAGDVFRRLVPRNFAKQLGEEVESATSPFQCALLARARCECVAHVLQGICEFDPTTITSIDDIAFDLVSLLNGLHRLAVGNRALPFVRMFCGDTSSYWWEDDGGVSHLIRQGEGGEQGDALTSSHWASTQYSKQSRGSSALVNGCSRTWTIFTSCPHLTESEQSTPSCNMSCSRMLGSACMARRKSGTWLGSDQKPVMCWSRLPKQPTPQLSCGEGGSEFPSVQQGIKILGAPLGHPDFVPAHLERTTAEHAVLLADSVGAGRPVCVASVAQARATYLLRALQPSLTEEFARSHDAGMWVCLCSIVQLPVDQCDEGVRHTAALPLVWGGLGLRSVERTRFAAFWASWRLLAHGVCATP